MLIELLRQAATRAPERPLLVTPTAQVTYDEALTRVRSIAQGLWSRSISRFGLDMTNEENILITLIASTAVGTEACVYPQVPDDAGLQRFASTFGHSVVLTDRRRGPLPLTTYALDDIATADGDLPPAPSSAPVLILTTGTTGAPKGARHDWSRLAAASHGRDRESPGRWLLAYNLNQFAGLQVLLHVLASQDTLVVPESRRAPDVIAAILANSVTHVSGTPTFWRLLTGTLDAHTAKSMALQQITLGGEATPEALIRRLRTLFPGARISHVYAGTEFGSAVSVTDGRSGLPISVLARNESAGSQMKIVDGELLIKSRVGMLGYHEGANTADEWRATGDLVELRGDRIHFVGRTTEIINVGGAKVHPLPIEELVCGVDGVEIAAVYGRPNAVTGEIVVMDVVAAPGFDEHELASAVRRACETLPAAGRPRRIRFVHELDTRGSKLVRGRTADRP